MDKKQLGKLGENVAEKFLTSNNHQIIRKNYYARFGEIDIISLEKGETTSLIFTEVKTRTQTRFGYPQEAITFRKLKNLLLAAQHFVKNSEEKLPWSWRFDLIAIQLTKKGHLISIDQIKNILDG